MPMAPRGRSLSSLLHCFAVVVVVDDGEDEGGGEVPFWGAVLFVEVLLVWFVSCMAGAGTCARATRGEGALTDWRETGAGVATVAGAGVGLAATTGAGCGAAAAGRNSWLSGFAGQVSGVCRSAMPFDSW